jgi:hypothetical protein
MDLLGFSACLAGSPIKLSINKTDSFSFCPSFFLLGFVHVMTRLMPMYKPDVDILVSGTI